MEWIGLHTRHVTGLSFRGLRGLQLTEGGHRLRFSAGPGVEVPCALAYCPDFASTCITRHCHRQNCACADFLAVDVYVKHRCSCKADSNFRAAAAFSPRVFVSSSITLTGHRRRRTIACDGSPLADRLRVGDGFAQRQKPPTPGGAAGAPAPAAIVGIIAIRVCGAA